MASTAGLQDHPRTACAFFCETVLPHRFAVKATGWIQRSIAALAGPTHYGQGTFMRQKPTAYDLVERKAVLGEREGAHLA